MLVTALKALGIDGGFCQVKIIHRKQCILPHSAHVYGWVFVFLPPGEDLYISLYGACEELSLHLEPDSILLKKTYISLANVHTVSLANSSDIPLQYKWSTWASQQEEDLCLLKYEDIQLYYPSHFSLFGNSCALSSFWPSTFITLSYLSPLPLSLGIAQHSGRQRRRWRRSSCFFRAILTPRRTIISRCCPETSRNTGARLQRTTCLPSQTTA